MKKSDDIIDLDTVEVSPNQEEEIKLRGKTIRNLIGFVGLHFAEIKIDFLQVGKKKCDHWERLRNEHGPTRGGCKFCPCFDGKTCFLKDKWIPMFKKEMK